MEKPDQSTKKNQPRIAIWMPLIIAICIAIGIFIGNAYKNSNNNNLLNFFPEASNKNNKVDFLMNYLNRYYVDSISTDKLIEDAIPRILSDLDPHSVYITKEEMLSKGTELEGYFGGIGVEFFINDDTINIVNVTKGGPSEKLGITYGDKIITVDDSIFVGIKLTNSKVVSKLRGELNSKVKLGIKRSGLDDLINFDVQRKEVPVKSIDAYYTLDQNIGYVKISRFASTTYSEFMTATNELQKQGASSFIIDLRDNSGGALNTAYKLTNEFLNVGDLILYTEGRTQKRENFVSDGRGKFKNNDLVVLINENSASASEIFAGTMQDLDRGLIIGRRSFGKGLVQSQFQFPDKSAMRITIARYHTPSGRCTQKPYTIGDSENYDLDILHRYQSGEFYNIDSLKIDSMHLPEFKTRKGRPIYGESGIMPDIFIGQDTVGWNLFFEKINMSGLLRSFSFTYANIHRDELKKMTITEAKNHLDKEDLMIPFLDYINKKKKIKPTSLELKNSRILINNYIKALIVRDIFSDENLFFSIIQSEDITIAKAKEMINTSKATTQAIGEEVYLLQNNSDEKK